MSKKVSGHSPQISSDDLRLAKKKALAEDNFFKLRDGAGKIGTGPGDDVVVARGSYEGIYTGADNDLVYLTEVSGPVFGGRGRDKIFIDQKLSEFDIEVVRKKMILTDRMTGEETVIRGFEKVSFADETYKITELAATYPPGAFPTLRVDDGTQFTSVNDPDPSVSVVWDRAAQFAVINTDQHAGPTMAARAYAMVHTAIYDAWASFDDTAVRVSLDEEGDNATLEAALTLSDAGKEKAMSLAAHAVLSDLFPERTELFDEILAKRYGLTPEGDGSAEAEIGLDAASDLLVLRSDDGSNQTGNYDDTTGYHTVNPDPENVNDITRWTAENVPIDSSDNGTRQHFLTPHWGEVEGFALPPGGTSDDYGIPEPQAFFTAKYEESVLDIAAGTIKLSAPLKIDGVFYRAGAKIEVSKDLIGPVVHPRFISQAQEVVDYSANLTDEHKMIAEFWEDAGSTSFPPGTSLTFAQMVSARDGYSIDDDAKMFLAASNGVLDGAIATWQSKVEYDYARPVRVIRDLGKLGLIGEKGVDEITGETGYVIEAFGGFDPVTGEGLGTRTILAENWDTYQRPDTHPSPPFAEYVSGHSAFSAAGAEILKLYTGSDEFGGSVTFPAGSAQFDSTTPEYDVTLYWETFTGAADEAGFSRRYGGIHFEDADIEGRKLGKALGEAAYEHALLFIEGEAEDADRPFYDGDMLF